MTRLSIDHSLLSPSGHVSRRAKRASDERVRQELFGDGLSWPTCPQPSERDILLRQAADLRVLADRGMRPRAYRRQAVELEKRANGERCSDCGKPLPPAEEPVSIGRRVCVACAKKYL